MNGRVVSSRIAAATIAAIALGACGAPAHRQTLDREPDLVRISGTIPGGFSASANEELHRLQAACEAIDTTVGSVLPDVRKENDVEHLALVDGQCEWVASGPELIIGILANPGGGGVLDQTASVLTDERPIAGVGDRAVFDPQTRTLYLVKNSRLWYLQLVGPGNGVAAPAILTTLGKELVLTRAATR